MEKITIKGTDYKLKYTIRAMFIYEQITGKPFGISTLLDNYIFFYSLILANNPDNVLDWDDFIEAIDNDKELIEQLNQIVTNFQKKDELFNTEEEGDSEKKN